MELNLENRKGYCTSNGHFLHEKDEEKRIEDFTSSKGKDEREKTNE